MIKVRIWGGLGNQMFQFAFAYALAKRNKTTFVLDVSFFENKHLPKRITPRMLGLFRYPNIVSDVQINKKKSLIVSLLQLPLFNFFLRKTNKDLVRVGNYFLEAKYQYHPFFEKDLKRNCYLDGYWHSELFFFEYAREIRDFFSFQDDMILSFRDHYFGKNKDTVAVHVRRGDYVLQNNPNIMDEHYYEKAIEYMKRQLNNPFFLFFSDDIQWVKSNFAYLKQALFVSDAYGLSDIQELQIMRLCKNQIISNSSYSWWAAWLNDNPDKIVIAPSSWQNKKDMMPSAWIKI